LLVVGFDRRTSRPLGGRPLLADLALLALGAAATLIAVRGLGNLLVAAVLVAPAATAQLLTGRLLRMMVLAIAVAALCSVGGASVAGLLVVAYLSVRVIRRGA
jgi:ABC-type Mn2+/Zn2+ transport system permease subunit